MKYLLKNGTVIDGSGQQRKTNDVLIENDKIIRIAENIIDEEAELIECSGLVVAPGFIDAHSHNDFYVDDLQSHNYFAPFIEQGITTQIAGNCGFSVFGIDDNSHYKDEVGGSLFPAKGDTTLEKWTDKTSGKMHVNIAPLIGHGTVKTGIAGIKGDKLNKEQISEMVRITKLAMEQGAFGGSLGLMYEPGIYSSYEELKAFTKALADEDGILTIHPRAESSVSMSYGMIGKSHIVRAFEETYKLVRDTNVRFEMSHLIFVGKKTWKCCDRLLKQIHKMNKDGYSYGYDIYPYTYGASVITVFLPDWYMKKDKAKRNKGFTKFKLKVLINLSKKMLGIGFEDMTVCYIGENYPQFEGKTISQIAKENRKKEMEMYLELVELSDGKGRLLIDKYYNQEIISKLMDDEYSICMTDAWYETAGTQNGSTYGAFPLFFKKAREMKMPLEKMVAKMTSITADRFKIEQRGRIEEGFFADITIFDPLTINASKTNSSRPTGIKYVIVNGNLVLKDGIYNGHASGTMLLKRK